MRFPAFVCLSVCEQDYSKTCAWIMLHGDRCWDMDKLINF